jgi:uncharacterized Zn finger protein (UPF0148 family)
VSGWVIVCPICNERKHVAKPNYQYEKRQRELEKKKKKAEKALRKTSPGEDSPVQDDNANPAEPPPAAVAPENK